MLHLSLTITQFSILVVFALLGVLVGIYVALDMLNQGRVPRKSKGVKAVRVGDENGEYLPDTDRHPDRQDPAEDGTKDLMTPKYDEGTILKQKLRREGTSLFELNCAADGEDPGDRVRAGQGGEDNAYSILKKQ